MRVFLSFLLVVFLGAAGYGYLHNPEGYVRLCHDFVALYTQTSVPADAEPQSTVESTPDSNPAPSTVAPTTEITPSTAPSTSSNTTTSTAVATAPAQPFKKWTPPAVIPAQPNWTWTTDDKTYQNVVITKIDAANVTITHSLGVTQLDIATLPADIQKQLNYDPTAAAATKAELQRESDHPYFPMSNIADAEALAKQMHWPIAWLFSSLDAFSVQNPSPDTWEGMTQVALNDLKTQTIVIFEKGNEELPLVPPAIIAELFHLDDGPLPGGHHYEPPKIVFSSPDATKTFGRVAYTQIKSAGMAPIDAILSNIQTDAAIQAILNGQPAPANSPSPLSNPTPSTPPVTAIKSAPTADTSTATTTAPTEPTKKWTPPATLPSQPNWTWTTSDGKTYQNVVINSIDSTTVTITHSTGIAHLDISTLPPDAQKQLNFDPATAAAVRAEAQAEAWTTDYQAALTMAKAQKKLVLLDFTGSDWCGYCQAIEREVFTQPSFKEFSGEHYVLVTVDFPHQTALGDDLKQQNDRLKTQYNVKDYPTLVVLDPNEKELGRSVGYDPGGGPDVIINWLQRFLQN